MVSGERFEIMANNYNDAKPVSNGYDFGDEWLDESEEALEFDNNVKPKSKEEQKEAPEAGAEGESELVACVSVDEEHAEIESEIEITSEFEPFSNVELDLDELPLPHGEDYITSDDLQSSGGADEELHGNDSDALDEQESISTEEFASEAALQFEPDTHEAGESLDVSLSSEEAALNVDIDVSRIEETEQESADAVSGENPAIEVGLEAEEHGAEGESSGDDICVSDVGGTKGMESGCAVTAQVLNIAALQREAERRREMSSTDHSDSDSDPLKDPQLWQFVSLIAMRLFDDLELLLVQKHCAEACDLSKQLNRLANILAFAGIGEQLPLIAYIGNMLPISFTDVEIGEHSMRRFDAMKMRRFLDKSSECLNCLVYLLNYLSKRSVGFDTGRFTDVLEKIYTALDIVPGRPSAEAPLAVTDDVNPHELTTRTVSKLSRTLEALITESMHYLESSVFYGYASGYEDASKSLNNATQIAREYKLNDFEAALTKLYMLVYKCRLPDIPPAEVYSIYRDICNMLDKHFAQTISDKKIKHLRALIAKFDASESSHSEEPFCNRWKTFIKAAAPCLDLERVRMSGLRARAQELSELAKANGIQWLYDTFEHLESYWENYGDSCAENFILLVDELRAFPTEDIEECDVEQLNHERLKVLFARKPDVRPQSAYSIINSAYHLSEILLQQQGSIHLISSAKIQELLIDARQIKCHSIERICEILLTLLDHVPKDGENYGVVADSVVNALYFTSGFLRAICHRLLKNLEHNQDSPTVTSRQLFYNELLAMYQTPGQPRDSVTWFIVKRLNSILAELQLVWVNTSTPTSTEYYCTLLRRLLHLATICEMSDVRQRLVSHLDDIPTQDFINTENLTMSRQCARIVRMIEEQCPKLSVLPSSVQVRQFFAKTIAALNQLLSSEDVSDSDRLVSEISRIETITSMLGMTTDYPPVIAFIYELHHMAFEDNLGRVHLEEILYQMINIANNVCPEWVEPKETELEFVKTALAIPMPLVQEMLESLGEIRESLRLHAQDEPDAWDRASTLYNKVHSLVNYVPYTLQTICQNAQNRCRYLKKHIYIDVDTSGYPDESDLPVDSVRNVIVVAFSSIIEKLIEIIIDNAFTATDYSSRINIILHPFPNEFSVSIFHNGKLLTLEEITKKLSDVNIMPADDDNLFDLLVSSRRLALTYPPVNSFAYILPLLRQFDGRMDISKDNTGNTRFYVSFKL